MFQKHLVFFLLRLESAVSPRNPSHCRRKMVFRNHGLGAGGEVLVSRPSPPVARTGHECERECVCVCADKCVSVSPHSHKCTPAQMHSLAHTLDPSLSASEFSPVSHWLASFPCRAICVFTSLMSSVLHSIHSRIPGPEEASPSSL